MNKEEFKEIRNKLKLTQKAMGAKIFRTKNCVYKYERGDLKILPLIADKVRSLAKD